MKKHFFPFVLLGVSFASQAQSNTVTAGGDASGSGGSVSYTIGQIDYMHAEGSGGSYNQGVQQPYEFYQNAGIGENDLLVTQVYPNPTFESIVLKLSDSAGDANFYLTDSRGRLVREGHADAGSTVIPMADLSAGEYLLTVHNTTLKSQTIKIIKH